MLEYDTENMNSDEIFSSLRGVTEAIQSFSYRSQEDLNEPIRRDGKKDDAVSALDFWETWTSVQMGNLITPISFLFFGYY